MSKTTVYSFKKYFLPLIISLFIVCFAFFALQIKGAEAEFFYTVRVQKLHPDVRSSILREARVTDGVTKSAIGRIESVVFTPHTEEHYSTLHDAIVQAPHPYFYDAKITVRAEGSKKGNGYALGAFTLFRGATVAFFTPHFTGVGECTEIYEGESVP